MAANHPGHPPIAEDRIESLPLGERWFPDAFSIMSVPGGFVLRLVDMTQAKAALEILRAAKVPATFTHLIVRAAALALARNPELHQMMAGYKRLSPGQVDIGLSMAGETAFAPVVVLPRADRTPLGQLVPSTNEAIAAARVKEKVDLANMRRFMWLIPFGFLRRFFLRLMSGSLGFRRKLVGTFQVSCLPSVDVITSFLFYTGSILGAGCVRDRVLAVDGQPVVRPTVWLTICVDHAVIDGRRAGDLINAIQKILEGDELVREATVACALSSPDSSVPASDDSSPGDRPLAPAQRGAAGGLS
jgi:pyruvate/2-oxoglutarate dehydrogenase complex dihydrolipoamide acyltransferase (E2) component